MVQRIVFLLVWLYAVTWVSATISFHPLVPLSVSVESTALPAPTIVDWVVSAQSITLTDTVKISARVQSSSYACDVTVTLSDHVDEWNQFRARVRRFHLSATGVDGWYNSSFAPLLPATFPRGTYFFAVQVVDYDPGSGGSTNAYSPAALSSQFGAGASTITLSDWLGGQWEGAANGWASVDRLIVTPTVVTSMDDVVAVNVHFQHDPLVTPEYGEPRFGAVDGAPYVAYIAASDACAGGWCNVSKALSEWSISTAPYGGVFTGVYTLSLVLYSGVTVLEITAPQLAQGGFARAVTLAGSAFGTDLTPPRCTFSFLPTHIDLDNDPPPNQYYAALELVHSCDEAIAIDGVWFLAPPSTEPPTFLDSMDAKATYSHNAVGIPKASLAGNYSLQAVMVLDWAGNVAVYSNAQPPIPESMWVQLGDLSEILSGLNSVWATLNASGQTSTEISSSSMAVVSSSSSSEISSSSSSFSFSSSSVAGSSSFSSTAAAVTVARSSSSSTDSGSTSNPHSSSSGSGGAFSSSSSGVVSISSEGMGRTDGRAIALTMAVFVILTFTFI